MSKKKKNDAIEENPDRVNRRFKKSPNKKRQKYQENLKQNSI